MAGTSLPGGFLERFDILWMAFLLMGLLFTLGSLLFYVSLIGEKERDVWKPQNLYVRIGTVFFIWLLSCAESGWSVRYGYFPFFPCHHGAARLLPEAYEKNCGLCVWRWAV